MRLYHSITLALLAFASTILSFSTKPGGEGFEIFLNNRAIVQQFGNDMKQVKTVSLAQQDIHQQLNIRYHHCGQSGKNRVITVRDQQHTVIKKWVYANNGSPMNCPVKDLVALAKKSGRLELMYSSDQLPGGRSLAFIAAP